MAINGNRATYDRGLCAEHYDLREEGLELSFEFPSLPPGEGDLLIDLDILSEFAPTPDPPGVVLCDADGAGLRLGGVTAISATGARTSTDLEVLGQTLRLRVPGEFLDSAVFPLVVDPLITGMLGNPFGGAAESSFTVGGPTGSMLVAWCWRIDARSGPHSVAVYRQLDGSGMGIGDAFSIESRVGWQNKSPRTAYVASIDTVVAATNVQGPGVSAPLHFHYFDQSLTGGGIGELGTPTEIVDVFDLGGESTALDDDLVVVRSRRSGSTRTILANELQLDPGAPTVLQERVLGQADPGSYLAISKGNGQAGRHLTVWTQGGNLMAAVLDRDLEILDTGRLGPAGQRAANAEVDGNGDHWLVAYRKDSGDLACLPVFWDSTTDSAYVGQERVIGPALLPNHRYWGRTSKPPQPIASVAFAGDSYLVSYLDGNDNSILLSIDPFDCRDCEGAFITFARVTPRTGSEERTNVPVASPHVDLMSPVNDQAVVVGDDTDFRFFRIDDGQNANLGGGCGRGGYAAGSCARVGHQAFTLRLRDSRKDAPAVGLLSAPAGGPVVCGSCTLHASLAGGVALPATVNAQGNVALPLPIPANPALLGQGLIAQWAVAGGAGCTGTFDLSDAASIVLQ
ncbi:MAG: hypothetical protein AAF628_17060 [Planctomycetota bacterium]